MALPRLLAAEPAAASAKSCIFIILSGGPSHIDTWDPKPNAPEEVRGPYQAIATRTPGVQVTDMFPRLAQVSNLYSLVRCLSHAEVPHVTAAHMMLSGQSDGRRQNKSPFIGSLISKFQPSAANMPSHVWLHNMKTPLRYGTWPGAGPGICIEPAALSFDKALATSPFSVGGTCKCDGR